MIKKLINLILSKFYKKSEAAQIAVLPVPDYSATPVEQTITQANGSEDAVFTAPFDCFVVARIALQATSGLKEAGANALLGVNGNLIWHNSRYYGNSMPASGSGIYLRYTAFARKGDEIAVKIDLWPDKTTLADYTLYFYPLIGGEHPAVES